MATKSWFGLASAALALALVPASLACEGCYGPTSHVEHVRHVKRMQPGALNATYGPKGPLEWGQLNIMHTTDTHGWLEGHLKERKYGADWGDFVSFSKHAKKLARKMGVDLLLVDTGDLHDGTGLSDATTPDGSLSWNVFNDVDYDLLSIGNHELYLADVAYQTLVNVSAYWGERYLTSNVQIANEKTGKWEYIGRTHRYFTTEHGLRIMAFGVLFDFTGNTNVTKVIPAKTLVTQKWFTDAVHTHKPIDAFVLIGHNPIRNSSFEVVVDAIRAVHPYTPIQILGGHTHIRDFVVYDESTVALESGRYCETLGWLSMSGFCPENSGYHGAMPNPTRAVNPTRKATETSTSSFRYARRYLDWNRKTFTYHSQTSDARFDTKDGLATTSQITGYRQQLNLTQLYGCVPQDYCMTCAPVDSPKSIFPLLGEALAQIVVRDDRKDKARYLIANTGNIRFDMYKGPFTFDDKFIVSPFTNTFVYIKDVPYEKASKVLAIINNTGAMEKRSLGYMPIERDICVDPIVEPLSMMRRDNDPVGISRRQVVDLVPGYVTKDDWGTDGDDTAHSSIPAYTIPDFFQGATGFDADGKADVVDLVFLNFIEPDILAALGSEYSATNIEEYLSPDFTSRDFLPLFVQQSPAFQADYPNCPGQ
ncbi:Metallo-dependent phosphatase-like protein [Xylaria nigripes]|nr:Metallo-dependent phosphatase-like protein [Xylaria nigripes]